MRTAVISDIHANLQAWRSLLRDLREAGAEAVICLGDSIGYGPEPQAVLDKLRSVTDDIVMGNHEAVLAGRMDVADFNDSARRLIEWTRERLDADSLKFLAGLPLALHGGGVLFTHAEAVEPARFQYIEGAGTARANLQGRPETLVFIGHTHVSGVFVLDARTGDIAHGTPPLLRLQPAVRYLVNAGSIGEPRDLDPRGSYAVYDDEAGTVGFRRFAFDIAAYRESLARSGLDYRPFFLASHYRSRLLADAGAVENPQAGGIPAAAWPMPRMRMVVPVGGERRP